MLETLLTLIVPGLGHLYYGYNKKGFLLIGLAIVASYLLPLYLFLYPYALYDIWKISKKSPEPQFKRSEAIKVILIGLVAPIVLVLIWAISIPYLLRYYQNAISFPNRVLAEGKEIVGALESYHKSFGKYPDRLSAIIDGMPLRKRWQNDPWGRPYYYRPDELLGSYTLLSRGPDGLEGTVDDHVIRNGRTKARDENTK